MTSISERLAKLPPEKYDLVLRRIQGRDVGEAASKVTGGQREKKKAFDIKTDENFRLVASQPGNLDSLALHACPRKEVGPGHVEIEVEAASLNFRDVMIALGMYPSPPGVTPVMGSDCAGRITAVGEDVRGFVVGDEVLAMTSDSFNAFTTAAAVTTVKKPSFLSFEEAASIPTVFLTDYYGLHYLARLSRGERVLIHSAAGGVGLAAVQMARWKEAEIFATVGTPEKRELMRSMGIEHVMDSRSLDFADDVMKITENEGVDVVLNSLAGEAIPKGLGILRPLGRFIELGKRDIYQNHEIGLLPFHKGLSFFAIELSPLLWKRPDFFSSMFAEMMTHFEEGVFKPLSIRTFGASEVAKAFKYMSEGVHVGKIVVNMKEAPVLVRSLAG